MTEPGRRSVLAGALVILTGMLAGLAIVVLPLAAWTIVGAALILLLLLAPSSVRVGATVLAAISSRLLVATGFFPELFNFFHFPLVLVTALVATLESGTRSTLQRNLGFGLIGLLGTCLLSWIIGGGQLIRPLLDWLVICEPFLLIHAILAQPPDPRSLRALWGLSLAFPFIQLPLAVYQALTLGLGDPVQGLFVGMVAGSHVTGAVALLGSLLCMARAAIASKAKARPLWLVGVAVLFIVAVLADAKQVIVAFFPAMALLLLGHLRLHWTRTIMALAVLAGVILGAFSYYRPLQAALDWAFISRGLFGKLQAFGVIASRLSSKAGGWIFGLGPGNSVSRVALMGMEGYIKPNSPVRLLGLNAAKTTLELWNLTYSNWQSAASSVWTSISSWLGLLGDLGLAGCALYLWMTWRLWRSLNSDAGWQSRLARAVLLMSMLLGFTYSWLEEPCFMLPAALIVGLGLASGRLREGTIVLRPYSNALERPKNEVLER